MAAGFDSGQRLAVQDVGRFRVARGMQSQKIGPAQEAVKIDLLGTEQPDRLFGQVWVVNDRFHFQGERPFDDQAADLAGPQNTQRFAGDFNAQVAIRIPLPALGRLVGARNPPGERKYHGDGVFGSRGRAAEGGVHDNHPLAVGGFQVKIAGADSGPANHLELLCGLENVFSHLGAAADDQRIGVRNRFDQLLI